MKAAALQIAGLIGLTVAGFLVLGVAGIVGGLSVAAIYVGLAMED